VNFEYFGDAISFKDSLKKKENAGYEAQTTKIDNLIVSFSKNLFEQPEAHVCRQAFDDFLGVRLRFHHVFAKGGVVLFLVLVALTHRLITGQRRDHLFERNQLKEQEVYMCMLLFIEAITT